MAINTLFQNIADAIREKTGSAGSLTPAQMPGAIRSISSGGLTVEQIGYSATSYSGTVIHLDHPLDEYDVIVFAVLKSVNYIENNFWLVADIIAQKTKDPSHDKIIGNYDDGSYMWYKITDMSTLTCHMVTSGAGAFPITIYGLKWG